MDKKLVTNWLHHIIILCHMIPFLTLSQTTNFRLFQLERVFRTILNLRERAERFLNRYKTLGEKEKLLVTSNFSFSHSVFKRLVWQTPKIQGLFGKGLSEHKRPYKNIEGQIYSVHKKYHIKKVQ